MIVAIVLSGLIFAILLTAFLSFYFTFYSSEKGRKDNPLYIPKGVIKKDKVSQVKLALEKFSEKEFECVKIKSFDNLKLCGKFYKIAADDSPIIIFFHGYRSSSYCDGMGAYRVAKKNGYNYLAVTQRAHGDSEGRVITFGVKERRDVISWVDYVTKRFSGAPIVLYGISMGATSVLCALDEELNKEVLNHKVYDKRLNERGIKDKVYAVVSDCGFSSAPNVIKEKISSKMKLPPFIFYPFVYLGALMFGGFNLKRADTLSALKNNKIPVIFLHGEKDDVVPIDMAKEEYAACGGKKRLIVFPEATHGTSFLTGPQKYLVNVSEFLQKNVKKYKKSVKKV